MERKKHEEYVKQIEVCLFNYRVDGFGNYNDHAFLSSSKPSSFFVRVYTVPSVICMACMLLLLYIVVLLILFFGLLDEMIRDILIEKTLQVMLIFMFCMVLLDSLVKVQYLSGVKYCSSLSGNFILNT